MSVAFIAKLVWRRRNFKIHLMECISESKGEKNISRFQFEISSDEILQIRMPVIT